MKCVDCGEEFEPKPVKKEIKVTLSNPGNITVNGTVNECPNCHQHYVEENEALKLMESFEKERIKQKH